MRKLKVTIDGIEQEISVSDEVYSAFMDPIWRKKKREQRRKLRKNEMDTISIEESQIPIADSDNPENIYLLKELCQELRSVMKMLSTDEADLIKSIYWGGLSLSNYSKQSGIPYTTLVYRHRKILKKLRLALDSTR